MKLVSFCPRSLHFTYSINFFSYTKTGGHYAGAWRQSNVEMCLRRCSSFKYNLVAKWKATEKNQKFCCKVSNSQVPFHLKKIKLELRLFNENPVVVSHRILERVYNCTYYTCIVHYCSWSMKYRFLKAVHSLTSNHE